MTDKEEPVTESTIEGTVKAVAGLVKAVPVYDDAIQPAAKEVGKSLETVAKSINVVLSPLRALVWGYDQIESFLNNAVATKLSATPPEEITSPNPSVAGPALEALRYAGHEESISDLYANLLAGSMDQLTATDSHPAFVEILKQLTPDEAKLLRIFSQHRPLPLLIVRSESVDKDKGGRDILVNFSTYGEEAGCSLPNKTPAYLDNLCRLGLIEIPTFLEYKAPNIYDPLENHPTVLAVKEQIDRDPILNFKIQRKGLQVTQLGRQFISVCVIDHLQKRANA